MATDKPKCALVLAAGLGTRMRPLSNFTPKPLIMVFGKTMLDHALDALAAAKVKQAVVNVHYLADQVEAHVSDRTDPKIIISDERQELMDSGGGVKKALPYLNEAPFYLLNADSFWIEGDTPNLDTLANFWNADNMDILLLLSPADQAVGFDGKGDFFMADNGRLARRGTHKFAPFVYAGAAIFSPKLFATAPKGPFSLNRLFDEAIFEGRLFGVKMEGLWLHVGTPEAIDLAEQAIAKSAA